MYVEQKIAHRSSLLIIKSASSPQLITRNWMDLRPQKERLIWMGSRRRVGWIDWQRVDSFNDHRGLLWSLMLWRRRRSALSLALTVPGGEQHSKFAYKVKRFPRINPAASVPVIPYYIQIIAYNSVPDWLTIDHLTSIQTNWTCEVSRRAEILELPRWLSHQLRRCVAPFRYLIAAAGWFFGLRAERRKNS